MLQVLSIAILVWLIRSHHGVFLDDFVWAGPLCAIIWSALRIAITLLNMDTLPCPCASKFYRIFVGGSKFDLPHTSGNGFSLHFSSVLLRYSKKFDRIARRFRERKFRPRYSEYFVPFTHLFFQSIADPHHFDRLTLCRRRVAHSSTPTHIPHLLSFDRSENCSVISSTTICLFQKFAINMQKYVTCYYCGAASRL